MKRPRPRRRLARILTSALRSVVPASVAGLVLCSGCSGGGTAPLPTGAAANDAQLLRGRTVYVEKCATCHGISGGGGAGPSLRDGRLQRDFPAPAAQVELVQKGRGAMPGWSGRLSEADIQAVVRYEREVLGTAGG